MKKISESILAGFSVLTLIILLSAVDTVYARTSISKIVEPIDSINANICDRNVVGDINAGIASKVIQANSVDIVTIDSAVSRINRNNSKPIDGGVITSRVIQPATIDPIAIDSINAIRVKADSIAFIDTGGLIGVIDRS